MSSLYATQLATLPDDVPAPVARRPRVARRRRPGQRRRRVADAAREAFVHAMSRASIVVASWPRSAPFIAWRYLPAREAAPSELRHVDAVALADLAQDARG